MSPEERARWQARAQAEVERAKRLEKKIAEGFAKLGRAWPGSVRSTANAGGE